MTNRLVGLFTALVIITVTAVFVAVHVMATKPHRVSAVRDPGIMMCQWIREASKDKTPFFEDSHSAGQQDAVYRHFNESQIGVLRDAGIRWIEAERRVKAEPIPAMEKELRLAEKGVSDTCAQNNVLFRMVPEPMPAVARSSR